MEHGVPSNSDQDIGRLYNILSSLSMKKKIQPKKRKKVSVYTPSNDSDELNPSFLFSTVNTELLVAIVNGEIDPLEIAKYTLQSRGLNKDGEWVGFNGDWE